MTDKRFLYRIIPRGLRVIGQVLRLGWQEPIGLVVPLALLLIMFSAPQLMGDMFVGMTAGTSDGGEDDSWLRLAFGLGISSMFLGLSCWYWTRASLQARCRRLDSAPNPHRAQDDDDWDCAREWAPRLALLLAGFLAVAPAILGWTHRDAIPGLAILISLAFVAAGLVLVCFRRDLRCRLRNRLGLPPSPRTDAPFVWLNRTTAIFAAAPFGWPSACLLLLVSLAAGWMIAELPEPIERNLHTPTAAIAALGLVVAPLVVLLALTRDAVSWLLFGLDRIARRLVGAEATRHASQPALAAPAEETNPRMHGSIANWSNGLGFLLLLVLLFTSVFGSSAHLYDVRKMDGTKLVESPRLSLPKGGCSEKPECPGVSASGQVARPTLEQALICWHAAQVARRPDEAGPIPAVILSAQGGASRAAIWMLSAMRLLDQKTDGEFGRHLFAISGVSGGSLGAVTYVLALRQYPRAGGGLNWEHARLSDGLRKLGQGDLLAVTVATYFLNDALGAVLTPFGIWDDVPDRGEALERAFERHWMWKDAFAIRREAAEGGFLALWNGDYRTLPQLFLNGTDAATGRRLITSSVRFDPSDDLFAGSDDLLQILGSDVRAATAVTNSARFPLISPAGRFKDQQGHARQVNDGGVVESYGARTAADVARQVRRIGATLTPQVVPVIVATSNDADGLASSRDAAACRERKAGGTGCEELAQTTVNCLAPPALVAITAATRRSSPFAAEGILPLLTLNAARGAHGQDALHILRREYCFADAEEPRPRPRMVHLALPKPDHNRGQAAPMNWVLNRDTRRFLLDYAPRVDFNLQQAELLAEALKDPRGVRRQQPDKVSAAAATAEGDASCPAHTEQPTATAKPATQDARADR